MQKKEDNGEAIARSMLTLANLKTIVIAIVIGEGSSGGALALGVGDKVLMLENAIYSVLSPEGFASILWKDSSRTAEAAEVMKMTAKDLYDFKVIDEIIKEPEDGGAEIDIKIVAENLKKSILKYLKELKKLSIDELTEKRYQKFRNMGEYKIPEE
jgi:acetyl-CoA carboxylase carboxyl transferase subunit alpha